MKKILIALLLAASLGAATVGGFVADPNNNYIDEVHYDASLKVIVIRVHAKVLLWTVDEYYGLNIKEDKDIEKIMKEVLGDTPSIVHLKKQ